MGKPPDTPGESAALPMINGKRRALVVDAPPTTVELAGDTVPPGGMIVVSVPVTVRPAPVLLTGAWAEVTSVTDPVEVPVPPRGPAVHVVVWLIVAVEQV